MGEFDIHAFKMSTTPCTFFLKGKCTRGSSCPFSHKPSAPVLCKFFQSPGGCTRGSSCKFVHESKVSAETKTETKTEAETETDELTPEDLLNIARFELDEDEDQDDEENLEELDEMLFKLEQDEWLEEQKKPVESS